MLSPELRELLLNGCAGHPPTRRTIIKLGGTAHLLVQWRKHREELMAECPLGFRCWGYWMYERRLRSIPRGEVSQLKAIRAMQLYRDDAERRHVHRRLSEIEQGRRQ